MMTEEGIGVETGDKGHGQEIETTGDFQNIESTNKKEFISKVTLPIK